MNPSIWEETFRIHSYDLDLTGRVAPATLCNYLQEVAGNHARQLGVAMEAMAARNLTWMLSRLHVQLDAFPGWRDQVVITTWPSGLDGLYATREFLLHDGAGQAFGRASSAWLIIDLARRRPVRMPAFIQAIPLPDRPLPIQAPFPRLAGALEAPLPACTFPIRRSDLDLNQHVNNVRYVDWALESVPQAATDGYRLAALEIHFRLETHHGDAVQALAAAEPDAALPTYRHRLNRTSDGREVALGRTRWTVL